MRHHAHANNKRIFFPTFQEEQEDSDLWNFENKYTWEFERDAVRFVSKDENESDDEEEEEEDVIQVVDGHKILSGYAEIFDELPGLEPLKKTWRGTRFTIPPPTTILRKGLRTFLTRSITIISHS